MSSNLPRRSFLMTLVASGAALFTMANAFAAKIEANDPQALALGYVPEASKADTKKFPKYAAGQKCGSCQLYQGGSADHGACALFAGKEVMAAGWCSAYQKKAG